MSKLYIVAGVLSLIIYPLILNTYFRIGTIRTKWGVFTGEEATTTVICYGILSCMFIFLGGKEVYKFIKSHSSETKNNKKN